MAAGLRSIGDYLLVEELTIAGRRRSDDEACWHRAIRRDAWGERTFAIKRGGGLRVPSGHPLFRLPRLAHINLAAPIGWGLGDEEQAFVVTDWIEGASLARLVEIGGPLPATAACLIIAQAARGIAHLHAVRVNGVSLLHRRLSPRKLLLGRSGTVTVIGLEEHCGVRTAKVIGAADGARGDDAYHAPERLDGELLDGRSDVFALGIILRFILTGAFDGAWHGPDPKGLDEVLRRATAINRSARYEDAGALARGLLECAGRGDAARADAAHDRLCDRSTLASLVAARMAQGQAAASERDGDRAAPAPMEQDDLPDDGEPAPSRPAARAGGGWRVRGRGALATGREAGGANVPGLATSMTDRNGGAIADPLRVGGLAAGGADAPLGTARTNAPDALVTDRVEARRPGEVPGRSWRIIAAAASVVVMASGAALALHSAPVEPSAPPPIAAIKDDRPRAGEEDPRGAVPGARPAVTANLASSEDRARTVLTAVAAALCATRPWSPTSTLPSELAGRLERVGARGEVDALVRDVLDGRRLPETVRASLMSRQNQGLPQLLPLAVLAEPSRSDLRLALIGQQLGLRRFRDPLRGGVASTPPSAVDEVCDRRAASAAFIRLAAGTPAAAALARFLAAGRPGSLIEWGGLRVAARSAVEDGEGLRIVLRIANPGATERPLDAASLRLVEPPGDEARPPAVRQDAAVMAASSVREIELRWSGAAVAVAAGVVIAFPDGQRLAIDVRPPAILTRHP